MESKIDQLIKRIQIGDIPKACNLPVALAYTVPDNSIAPGTQEYKPSLFVMNTN